MSFMDASPWIGLVGVALGAGMSYVASALTERSRLRHETSARWEARLVDAIASYSSALKMQSRICLRIAGSYWPPMTTNPIDPQDGRRALAEYEDERSAEFERLLLLADESVVAAARAWQEAVWALHPIQNGPEVMGRERFEAQLRVAALRRDAFYAGARAQLGVAGFGSIAPDRVSRLDPTWQSESKK